MKRFFIISICIVLCVFLISACGSKEPTSTDKMNINGALVIGYSTPITGSYTTVEISPPDSLAGVEFMTYEAGGGKRYSPTIKVEYEKYTDMVAQMIALYGQPTKQLGDTYQWIAESGDFKLSMTYDKDIFHCMAIGVNR